MLANEKLLEGRARTLSKVTFIHNAFIEQFGEDKVELVFNTGSDEEFLAWCTARIKTVEAQMNKNLAEGENRKSATVSSLKMIEYFNQFARPYILVWWPEVTIENEGGRKHDIYDLYAKVEFKLDGTLVESRGFTLNRTTYTDAEWESNYMHSHINSIPKGHLSSFQHPCIGSGPINAPVRILLSNYDEDWWGTFIFELSRYVKVESLAGVPYKKMSNIVTTSAQARSNPIRFEDYVSVPYLLNSSTPEVLRTLISNFIRNYVTNFNESIDYTSNFFKINLTYQDFLFKVSSAFIDYVNTNANASEVSLSDLLNSNIICACVVDNNIIYKYETPAEIHNNRYTVLTFKGEPKKLTIKKVLRNNLIPNVKYLLNVDIAQYIRFSIINYINYYYGI